MLNRAGFLLCSLAFVLPFPPPVGRLCRILFCCLPASFHRPKFLAAQPLYTAGCRRRQILIFCLPPPSPLLFLFLFLFSNLLLSESSPSLFPQIPQCLFSLSFAARLPASTLSLQVLAPFVSTHVPGLIDHLSQNRLSMSQSTKRHREIDAEDSSEDSSDVVQTNRASGCLVPALEIVWPSDDVCCAVQNLLI